jgi:LacI family transcriptional regulator
MLNPLFYAMARGAEHAARAAGMTIVLGNSDDDAALEAKYLTTMAEHRVDGIILVPTPHTIAAQIPTLPQNVPLVLLDRRPPDLAARLISCNTANATRDLCRHLISIGHEHIALIGGMTEVPTWLNRITGYQEAQREAARPEAEDLIIHGNYRADSGIAAVRELMALPHPPDAIIAASAQVLHGVLEELAAMGKSIPADISVCCVDDPALPAVFRPRFTYVKQPGYEMGIAAVEAIVQELQTGETNHEDREFMAELRIGESCGEGERIVLSQERETMVPAARLRA